MLQIIIFQLSALIWATTANNKSAGIQMLGIILAVAFLALSQAQVNSTPSLVP